MREAVTLPQSRHQRRLAAAATGACVVSDGENAPTVRILQQLSGRPDGLHWFAKSSSEALASQTRTSKACG